MPKPLTVVIITCLRKGANVETATLTFRTIRTGFPTAQIVVYDNGSEYELKQTVKSLAASVDAIWDDHYTRMPHAYCMSRIAKERSNVVFVDPDVIFWKCCEDWEFPTALAGRYIPTHRSEYTKSRTISRLHTSFLWADHDRLLQELAAIGYEDREYAPAELWHPHMVYENCIPTFYDTAANLYHCVGGTAFESKHLDSYDHIFCGSSFDVAAQHLDHAKELMMVHHTALTNPSALRGLWKDQDEYFYNTRKL
jgi:hypothetical protein